MSSLLIETIDIPINDRKWPSFNEGLRTGEPNPGIGIRTLGIIASQGYAHGDKGLRCLAPDSF